MKRFRFGGLLVAAALVVAAPVSAQSSAYYMQQRGMNERFRLDIGGFFQKFETTLTQDASQFNIAADGYWRFGPHGRLDFSYRGWNRTNTHTLTRDITFGDTTYHVGATLDSQLRVSLAELYYSYSFVNNGDVELGLGLGLSTYLTKAELDGVGTISGGTGGGTASRSVEGRSLVAPIPSIKGYFVYTLYPRVFLSAAAKGITATINGYHASMQDYRGGLDWVFTQHFGAGAKYQYVKIDFSYAGSNGDLGFSYKYQGPLVYLIVAF